MERARRDKQHMVGLHRPIFGGDRGSFDQWQQIALNAFAADRSAANVADRDLVDLIEKDDAVRLRVRQRRAPKLVLVEPLVRLFLDQFFPR